MTKIRGLKSAVRDFNHAYNTARIYFDKAGGHVWTNTYSDCNSWTAYRDPNVVEVYFGVNLDFYPQHLTMAKLKFIVSEVLKGRDADCASEAYDYLLMSDYAKTI